MINDVSQMSTLLQKMKNETSGPDIQFDDNQIKAVVEVMIPRMLTGMPGLPAGMNVEFLDKTDKSWTIRVTRP